MFDEPSAPTPTPSSDNMMTEAEINKEDLRDELFGFAEDRINAARRGRVRVQLSTTGIIAIMTGLLVALGMENVYAAYATFFLGLAFGWILIYALTLAMQAPDIVEASIYLGIIPYVCVLAVTYVWFMASELLIRARIIETHCEHDLIFVYGATHVCLVTVSLLVRNWRLTQVLLGLNVIALIFPSTNVHLVASLSQTLCRLGVLLAMNGVLEWTSVDQVVKLANSGPTKLSILLMSTGRASMERSVAVLWVLIAPFMCVFAGSLVILLVYEGMRRQKGASHAVSAEDKQQLDTVDYSALVDGLRGKHSRVTL